MYKVKFRLISVFNGTSTSVCYKMPKPSLHKNCRGTIWPKAGGFVFLGGIVHTFSKGLIPKANEITPMETALADYDVTVLHQSVTPQGLPRQCEGGRNNEWWFRIMNKLSDSEAASICTCSTTIQLLARRDLSIFYVSTDTAQSQLFTRMDILTRRLLKGLGYLHQAWVAL